MNASERQNTQDLQQGGVVVKLLVIVPLTLVLLVVGTIAFYQGRKTYWDYRVRVMCKKDGGVTVYERVPIPSEYVDPDGTIRIPAKPSVTGRRLAFEAKSTDLLYYEWVNEPIKTGSLSVGKHTLNIVRSSDKKILGKLVVYSRSGGDIPTFAHPSSMSCPHVKGRSDILKQVFLVNDPSKE